ncbi:MAG: hypothetical protein DWB42_17990 [Chloroflexi bacterium]|jgi:hypothetical protein|nr:hypothetical protein [Chloroflexota bacterium]MDL1882153.1 hypothetical protein [Anaerolineae bacterium CFX8]GIL14418.1 MAG: hypothetical protein BroJett038_31380 [Chloroflexota bacterium]
MLDDLRKSAAENDFDFEEDDDAFAVEEDTEHKVDKLFLGMTAVERMFLTIFLFMNVCVLGIALLLATGRLVF